MENNETRTLWISIGSALFAIFLLYSYSQEKQAEYQRKFGSLKRVVVASTDIAEMQTIDETMLQIIERPVDFIEPKAHADPQDIVGMVAAAPIKEGEQILGTKILSPGVSTGIALQIAPGKRAVALPVDEIRGIAKLIRPGDRIDILAALDVGSGTNMKREIKTIMQDIVILATGQKIVNNLPRLLEVDKRSGSVGILNINQDTTFNTVTLEVSPKEAQDLTYILSTAPGNLFFVLRNPNDRQRNSLPMANIKTIQGQISRRPAPTPRLPAFTPPKPAPAPKKKGKRKRGPYKEI